MQQWPATEAAGLPELVEGLLPTDQSSAAQSQFQDDNEEKSAVKSTADPSQNKNGVQYV